MKRQDRNSAPLAHAPPAHATCVVLQEHPLSYAILGIALLWFVGRSDRSAVRAAPVAYTVGLVVLAAVVLPVASAPQPTGTAGFVADPASVDIAFRGWFTDAASARVAALPEVLVVLGVLNWSTALAMFLLGLVADRRGMPSRPREHPMLWRRLLIAGAVVPPAEERDPTQAKAQAGAGQT